MWDAHRRHYGHDGPVLIWRADTRTMNPSVPQRVIDEAYERDPAWAAAEYGAQFRSDLEAFVSHEVLQACVDVGVYERVPLDHRTRYIAFTDPSGGSADSMTLAIGHREKDGTVTRLSKHRSACSTASSKNELPPPSQTVQRHPVLPISSQRPRPPPPRRERPPRGLARALLTLPLRRQTWPPLGVKWRMVFSNATECVRQFAGSVSGWLR
jgi:hypothetical protein